jgi:3-hydroxyacyl-CoA dehydrogenase
MQEQCRLSDDSGGRIHMDGSDGCASLAYGNEGFVSDAFQQTEIPNLIDDIVKEGGKGVANGKGFYDYEPGESRLWEETFAEFTYEIRKLALKYPADIVKKDSRKKNE